MLICQLALYLHSLLKIKMYAIVEISGRQFKVEKKQKLFVNRLDVAEGKKISFENVLMVNDGAKFSVGSPNVSGAQVDAKVLKHLKSDKVIVFKKKRRQGYKRKKGHRQNQTILRVIDINGKGALKTIAKKKVETAKPKISEKEATGSKTKAPTNEKKTGTKASTVKEREDAKATTPKKKVVTKKKTKAVETPTEEKSAPKAKSSTKKTKEK